MVTVVRSKEPNTLQPKMGFEDADLKRPDHDAIMIWLDTNIESVVYSPYDIEYVPWHWSASRIAELRRDAIQAADEMNGSWLTAEEAAFLEDVQNLATPECKRLKVGKPTWEVPITTGSNNTYTVGFVDLCVTVLSEPTLSLEVPSVARQISSGRQDWWNDPRVQVPTARPYIKVTYQRQETLRFEVKSTIQSIGELIRQIRYYQTYRDGTYVVVSPDGRWTTQLESQNIRFVPVDVPTGAA